MQFSHALALTTESQQFARGCTRLLTRIALQLERLRHGPTAEPLRARFREGPQLLSHQAWPILRRQMPLVCKPGEHRESSKRNSFGSSNRLRSRVIPVNNKRRNWAFRTDWFEVQSFGAQKNSQLGLVHYADPELVSPYWVTRVRSSVALPDVPSAMVKTTSPLRWSPDSTRAPL